MKRSPTSKRRPERAAAHIASSLSPDRVIPEQLAIAIRDLPTWFVIGGHAVRCFCPYRPSRDVDFGVATAKHLDELLNKLSRTGDVVVSERSKTTAYLSWSGLDVSIFVLPHLAPFARGRTLDVTGILGTKLHAILDRGTRRDFFDLYVTLQHHQLGIVECLRAIRLVHQQDVNDQLLLRALTYFDDADAEARLPNEGRGDWATVKDFFLSSIGALIVAPRSRLAIQRQVVDVSDGQGSNRHPRRSEIKRRGPR